MSAGGRGLKPTRQVAEVAVKKVSSGLTCTPACRAIGSDNSAAPTAITAMKQTTMARIGDKRRIGARRFDPRIINIVEAAARWSAMHLLPRHYSAVRPVRKLAGAHGTRKRTMP